MSSQTYSNPPLTRCSAAPSVSPSPELKLYQAFIFSLPIFFTLILLLFFYLFYLQRERVDWSSLRMRTSLHTRNNMSPSELGLTKELREMLPVIIFKQSFSVKDAQCSVCLGDYLPEDRLQQIPACGHTFHMDCINHWLATHTTCPLCRLSLLASANSRETQADPSCRHIHAENGGETSSEMMFPSCEYPQISRESLECRNRDERVIQIRTGEGRDSHPLGRSRV